MQFSLFRHDSSTQKEFHYLLASDLHQDAPLFDRKVFLQDFEQAKALQARIFINGDVSSQILNKDVKRWSKSQDKDLRDDKLNQIVYQAFDLLVPYVDLIDVIGLGNHEVSTIKHNSFDAVNMLIRLLNERRKKLLPPIRHGGYEGVLRLVYTIHGGHGRKFDIFYNHGQGGSSEVTLGTIDLDRYCKWVGLDVIWLGHKHKRVVAELPPLMTVSSKNKLLFRRRYGVITGCYEQIFDVYDIEKSGYKISFSEERQRIPQTQHGVFLRQTIGDEIQTRVLF
jgi:hypothetical protein